MGIRNSLSSGKLPNGTDPGNNSEKCNRRGDTDGGQNRGGPKPATSTAFIHWRLPGTRHESTSANSKDGRHRHEISANRRKQYELVKTVARNGQSCRKNQSKAASGLYHVLTGGRPTANRLSPKKREYHTKRRSHGDTRHNPLRSHNPKQNAPHQILIPFESPPAANTGRQRTEIRTGQTRPDRTIASKPHHP